MIFALLPVLVIQVLMVASFDMYPWGKYDFKETSDDLLDLLRESEHLNVWESTLASTLPTSKDYLVLKNSEGNTFQLGRKSPASATRGSTLKQANDLKSISAALENTCGMFVDGFWTYEWCHGKEVRQFHLEQQGNTMKQDPNWSLGKQTRMLAMREKHEGDSSEEANKRPISKIVEYFEGGQKCEENRSQRSTEVEIICCEGTDFKNYIASSIYYGILDNPTNYNLNGFKLPAATLSGISEPRVCRYKATVCSPLLCKRPDIVATPAPTTVALKDSSVPQLVPIMKHINSTCLTKQEDWWTYELCFNSGVRQVRYETEQSLTADGKLVLKQSLVSQYQLGLAPLALYTNETELKKLVIGTPGSEAMSETEMQIMRSAGMVTPSFRTRRRDPHFVSLEFLHGTPCDLDDVNRTTVVDMYCGNKNRLVSIWEDSTCHYHVKVELAILCSFSDFVPYKENTTVVEFLPFEYTILKEEEEPETPIESISALAVGSSDTHPQTQLEPDVAGATTAAATATSEAPAGATLDQYKLAQDWLAKVSGSGAPAPAPSTAQSVIVDAAAAAVGVEGEVQWVEPVQSEAAEEVSTGAEAPDEDSFHQHADHIDGTDAPLENSVEASAVVDVVSLEESPVEDSAIKASVEIPAQAEETATEEEGEAVVENIVPAAVVDVSATEELSRADASTTTEASAVGQSSAADLTDTSAGKEQGTVQMADDAEEEVITHEDADPQQQRQLETEDFLDLDSYLRDDFLVDVRDMYPNFDVVSLLMRLQAEMGHFRVSKRILIQNIEAVIQRDAGRSRDN